MQSYLFIWSCCLRTCWDTVWDTVKEPCELLRCCCISYICFLAELCYSWIHSAIHYLPFIPGRVLGAAGLAGCIHYFPLPSQLPGGPRGQTRYVVSPACSGSNLGPASSWNMPGKPPAGWRPISILIACLNHLSWGLLNAKKQQLYSLATLHYAP